MRGSFRAAANAGTGSIRCCGGLGRGEVETEVLDGGRGGSLRDDNAGCCCGYTSTAAVAVPAPTITPAILMSPVLIDKRREARLKSTRKDSVWS